MMMLLVQLLFQLVLCSLCIPEKFADTTPVHIEELACIPGTKCNCLISNLTVVVCNVSDGLFTLPIDVPPQLRNFKIVGQNYSINISNQEYGNSWQSVEELEIFGDGDEGDLRLPNVFTEKLRQIKLFRIRNAGLRSIDLLAFSQMMALEHLDLSHNAFLSFEEVSDGLAGFEPGTLKTLYLSGIHNGERMGIYSINYESFMYVSSIQSLDISWTRVAVHFASFESLPNLRMLDLSGTHTIYGNCVWTLTRLQHIQELRMDYWPTIAPKARQRRDSPSDNWEKYSKEWWFYGCRNISGVLNGCFILPPSMKRLSLMNSEAAEFYIDFQEDVCINSTKLEYLNLRNLRITKSIGTITGLHSLKAIDVSNTGIPFSLRLFHDMGSLKEAYASGNRLNEVENEAELHKLFIYNYDLEMVDLSHNGMTAIPYDLFRHNGQLEQINLSNNKLETLHLDLRVCTSLIKLSLSDNQFKVMDGIMDINLEFVVTINNTLVISEIVKETGISCKCTNNTRSLAILDPQVYDNDNCIGFADTRNISKDGAETYSIKCSNGKLGLVAPLNKSTDTANFPNTIPLITGISIPVCALVVITITTALIRKKMQIRKITTIEEQIVLKEIDQENDERAEVILPVQEGTPQEIDNEVIVAAGENHHVPDQIIVNAEAARPVSNQIVQETGHETNEESTQTVPDQIYYIGLNEDTYSTNDRNPCFAAFLAYSHLDRDFVIDNIYYPLQRMLHELLPNWDEEYLTVLYDKHFLPGQCTMEVCRAAVFNSHVTVPIISDAFSRSTWCHHEIELAIEARAPIVPVYIPGVHKDRFPAVVKYVYEHKVRVIWPDTNEGETPSKEELSVIRDIAFSISTYVKHALDKAGV